MAHLSDKKCKKCNKKTVLFIRAMKGKKHVFRFYWCATCDNRFTIKTEEQNIGGIFCPRCKSYIVSHILEEKTFIHYRCDRCKLWFATFSKEKMKQLAKELKGEL